MDVRRNEEVEIPMPINSSYPVGHGRGHVHLHHQHLTNIVSSLPPPPSIQSPDPPLTDAEPVSSRTTGGRMIPGTAAATGNLVIIHEIENNHHNKSIQNHDDDDNNKAAAVPVSSNTVRYRECLKNHAATMGGNATDGCGEFMPLGEDGTMEALICSACNCHRNFHRKEVDHHHHHDPPPPLNLTQQYYYYNHDNDIRHRKTANGRTKKKMSGSNEFFTTKSSSSLLFPTMNISIPYLSPSDSSHVQHQLGNGSTTAELANYRSGLTGIFPPAAAPSLSSPVQVNHHRHHHHRQMMMKKRYRTKFTAEQKEKMLRFAERVEWKLQKQEESVVQQFCQEIGVKRKVLKVWMHNNKHNFSNKMVNNNGSSNPTATTTTTTTNVNVMISNNTD